LKVLLVFLFALNAFAESAKTVGQDFPSVNLKSLMTSKGGDPVQLAKGKKATFVDFWASWCKPCLASMPALNDIYEKYKSKGLLIVGINLDEKIADGKKFFKTKKIKFPVLYDEDRKLAESVGVTVMPSSYIVNSDGKITYVHRGFREGDKEKIIGEIEKVLSK
jgi:thiol-disulfide isomerase/thioredoxin